MIDFQVGERVADVPYYNWKMHVAGVPLAEIPDVRYGEIVSKWVLRGYPFYTVHFDGAKNEELDGRNFVRVEVKDE